MSSITENWPWAFCHSGSLEYNTPGVLCWYLGRVLLHLWSSTQLYCSTEFVMATQTVTCQPVSHLENVMYIFVLLSVRDFHMTSDVSHWAAVLCQLMGLWVGKLTSGCS